MDNGIKEIKVKCNKPKRIISSNILGEIVPFNKVLKKLYPNVSSLTINTFTNINYKE